MLSQSASSGGQSPSLGISGFAGMKEVAFSDCCCCHSLDCSAADILYSSSLVLFSFLVRFCA